MALTADKDKGEKRISKKKQTSEKLIRMNHGETKRMEYT